MESGATFNTGENAQGKKPTTIVNLRLFALMRKGEGRVVRKGRSGGDGGRVAVREKNGKMQMIYVI